MKKKNKQTTKSIKLETRSVRGLSTIVFVMMTVYISRVREREYVSLCMCLLCPCKPFIFFSFFVITWFSVVNFPRPLTFGKIARTFISVMRIIYFFREVFPQLLWKLWELLRALVEKMYAKVTATCGKISYHRFFFFGGGHFLRVDPIRKIARTFISVTRIILFFSEKFFPQLLWKTLRTIASTSGKKCNAKVTATCAKN